jgi:hypothetical protein
VAPDRIAHAFGAAFLVPLDAVGPDGVALEVGDQDGLRSDTAELLGRIKLTRRDFRDLLASAARQKTRSDGSVTRLEISARRYRRGRGGTVRLDDRNRAALSPVRFVAGESIMLRARGREDVVAIVGGQLTSFTIGRCSRAVVRSAGGAVVALEGADEPAVVTISIEKPTLKLWRAAVPSADCDGGGTRRSSTATVSALTISSNVASPSADQVRKVVEHRYLEGIRRCHERVLRTDATAVGSVRVLYRIAATGSSNFINVNGFDSTVDTCIESIIGKWRFAAPKDTAGQPTSADVDLQLAL